MSNHEVASALLGSHFLSGDPIGITRTPSYLCGGALQENRKQLSAVTPNYSLEQFECRQVIRVYVHKRH
jgi:hypothetical protein